VNTDTIKEQLFRSFRDKKQRHRFASLHFFTNIAAQISAIRESLSAMTQQQLADRANMAQPRIALLEASEHQNVSIKTLQRIAEAFDMAFIGRFVSFGELADWIAHSPASLVPPEFKQDPFHLTFLSPQRESVPDEQKDKAATSTPVAGAAALTGYAPTVLVTARVTTAVESRGPKQPTPPWSSNLRPDRKLQEQEQQEQEVLV